MEQHLYRAMEQAATQEDEQMVRTLARVQKRLRAMQQTLLQAPRPRFGSACGPGGGLTAPGGDG